MKAFGALLIGIGAVLMLSGIVWGFFIGYYDEDLPALLFLLFVGPALLWLGTKAHKAGESPPAPANWRPESDSQGLASAAKAESPTLGASSNTDDDSTEEPPVMTEFAVPEASDTDGAVAPQVTHPPAIVEPETLDERTSLVTRVPRVSSGWQLELPDGRVVPMRGAVLIGRDPTAAEDQQVADLISVDDDERSVSKTHALVDLRAGKVCVRDLGSTNGTMIVALDGTEVDCSLPGDHWVEAGSVIEVGQYEVLVSQATEK